MNAIRLRRIREHYRILRDALGDPFIRCAHQGIVYLYARDTFGVWLHSGKPLKSLNALRKRWPRIHSAQLGEDEFTFTFKPSSPQEALAFLASIGGHRKRSYSPDTLQRLREAGKARAALSRPWEKRQRNAA